MKEEALGLIRSDTGNYLGFCTRLSGFGLRQFKVLRLLQTLQDMSDAETVQNFSLAQHPDLNSKRSPSQNSMGNYLGPCMISFLPVALCFV